VLYQTIVTKFLGPTNFRGSRVKASAEAGSITLSWDYRKNIDDNHVAAARALAEKLEWAGHWRGGALPGSSYAFVRTENGSSDFLVISAEAERLVESFNPSARTADNPLGRIGAARDGASS
jgi:hypothetical protein